MCWTRWVGALCAAAWIVGCDELAGVDPCGKGCASDDECGSGYACEAGVCGGAGCGTTSSGGSSSSSSSGSGSSQGTSSGATSGGLSGSTSLAPGTSAAGSSGAASGTSQPVASSLGASSGGPASGGTSSAQGSSAASAVRSSSAAPSSSAVNCAVVAVGTPCGTNKFCNASAACVTGCFIDGAVRAPGNDPTNPCQRCDPSVDTAAWRLNPEDSPCGSTADACTIQRCTAGSCGDAPRCLNPTPTCASGTGACTCLASPDSCAVAATNKRCLGTGQCGCTDAADCASAQQCTGGACAPCNSADVCGSDCLPCRGLPMTLDEGDYYTCSGNTRPAALACLVAACAATRANCDADDLNACERNLQNDASHCGGCGVACGSGKLCREGRCDCTTGGTDCPAGQDCAVERCRCTATTGCNAGYNCVSDACARP